MYDAMLSTLHEPQRVAFYDVSCAFQTPEDRLTLFGLIQLGIDEDDDGNINRNFSVEIMPVMCHYFAKNFGWLSLKTDPLLGPELHTNSGALVKIHSVKIYPSGLFHHLSAATGYINLQKCPKIFKALHDKWRLLRPETEAFANRIINDREFRNETRNWRTEFRFEASSATDAADFVAEKLSTKRDIVKFFKTQFRLELGTVTYKLTSYSRIVKNMNQCIATNRLFAGDNNNSIMNTDSRSVYMSYLNHIGISYKPFPLVSSLARDIWPDFNQVFTGNSIQGYLECQTFRLIAESESNDDLQDADSELITTPELLCFDLAEYVSCKPHGRKMYKIKGKSGGAYEIGQTKKTAVKIFVRTHHNDWFMLMFVKVSERQNPDYLTLVEQYELNQEINDWIEEELVQPILQPTIIRHIVRRRRNL
jgi:hypothetical protein